MTESEFIKNYRYKIYARWHSILRKVDRTGNVGRDASETLLINEMIQFGSPRPEINNPYNCYRLTDKGREFLNK